MAGKAKKNPITIRMDEPHEHKFRELAEKLGLSLSDLCEKMVDASYERLLSAAEQTNAFRDKVLGK